jgi:tRNA (cytidine/uridine-2'-O-)-methyltransferase
MTEPQRAEGVRQQPRLHVVLYRPEIPNNTGTIGRLCVGTLTPLHLVRPLGFRIDDKTVRRAGLDYWKHVDLHVHDALEQALSGAGQVLYYSAHARRPYTECRHAEGDYLVFGGESRGLPRSLLETHSEAAYRIPMWGPVRSLNLANAVSIVLYEAFRQLGALA